MKKKLYQYRSSLHEIMNPIELKLSPFKQVHPNFTKESALIQNEKEFFFWNMTLWKP